jgi:hypothetical protein
LRQANYLSRGVIPSVMCLTEYDLETSTRRRPRPTRAVEPWGGGDPCFLDRSWNLSPSIVERLSRNLKACGKWYGCLNKAEIERYHQ